MDSSSCLCLFITFVKFLLRWLRVVYCSQNLLVYCTSTSDFKRHGGISRVNVIPSCTPGNACDSDTSFRSCWLSVGSNARWQSPSVRVTRLTNKFCLLIGVGNCSMFAKIVADRLKMWTPPCLMSTVWIKLVTGLGCLGDSWSDDNSTQRRHSSDTNCWTADVFLLAAFQLFRCRSITRLGWCRSSLGQKWSITSRVQETKSSNFRMSTPAGQKVWLNAVFRLVLSSAIFVHSCVCLCRNLHSIDEWLNWVDRCWCVEEVFFQSLSLMSQFQSRRFNGRQQRILLTSTNVFKLQQTEF